MEKANRKIVVKDFYCKNEHLYEDELGWQPANYREARSMVDKTVFNYYVVNCCLNVGFYYVDKDTFYGIHTEQTPVEVKVLPRYRNPEKPIASQCDVDTHDDGEVLFSFKNREDIYDNVIINGLPLGEVLKRSSIITLN